MFYFFLPHPFSRCRSLEFLFHEVLDPPSERFRSPVLLTTSARLDSIRADQSPSFPTDGNVFVLALVLFC